MMIKIETSISTPAFEFAVTTAQSWFPDTNVVGDDCIILVGRQDLKDENTRELLCSLCGNTPGLADALLESLSKSSHLDPGSYDLEIIMHRDDGVEITANHPRDNIERVRRALL